MDPAIIGASPPRLDGWDKAAGLTRFVDDLRVPGLWVGGTVRSPAARGRITRIARDPGFDWSGVIVLTAADLPGPNAVGMIRDDHPILADREVRFVSEAVALVAAPDPARLRGALASIRIELDELPPVLTIEESLHGGTIIWGEDNVIAEYAIECGDLAAGFAEAEVVVEGTWRTGRQEHAYLEPNGAIAFPRGSGVEIVGSLQCPYYVHAALVKGLALPADKVVVRQAPTGGAFGGKEDFPSVLCLHAALLALRAGRPVKMVYDRTEDMRATPKRHPSLARHRTGARRDGSLTAAEIDLTLDGGAYTTLSPVVLSRALLHAHSAYRLPAARIRGRVVATNNPPNGAFRGFGAPQAIFAMERQMDRLARRLAMDPAELRRRNLLRRGDRLPCGQLLREEPGAALVLERALELSGYQEKKRSAEYHRPARAVRRGIGLSVYLHGAGFTGSGEEKIAGRASVRFDPGAACIEVLVSNVEMGQGASTVLCQIASEALGLPLERVRHAEPDTSRVPNSGPTVASRTSMVVGRIVADACADLLGSLRAWLAARERVAPEEIFYAAGLFRTGGRPLGTFGECASRYVLETGPLEGSAVYKPAPGVRWDDAAYRGDAYGAYAWGADVVEVEVDADTLEARPVKATVVVEIGRAIHPVLAAGQVEGGTLQALGFASLEEIKSEAGRVLNDRLATYIVPTAEDAPEIQTEIIGLSGEPKGLGELPADGGAPALAAAIEDATGLVPDELPITPERLLDLEARREAGGP